MHLIFFIYSANFMSIIPCFIQNAEQININLKKDLIQSSHLPQIVFRLQLQTHVSVL